MGCASPLVCCCGRSRRTPAPSTTSSASSRASVGRRFELKGGEIYHNSWIAGLFLVVGFTGLAVLMATLFNLITDLVGGIRVSVLEEEVVAREDRGLGWRRGGRSRPVVPEEKEPG
jgi:hypothetical protein